ncbi:MAG: hypothetical protein ACO1TE_24255 [Prosthecobacter sp.]
MAVDGQVFEDGLIFIPCTMKLFSSMQPGFVIGLCAFALACSAPPAFAFTWEGRSLTLTLPDSFIVYDSMWAARTRRDDYGGSWKAHGRSHSFELYQLGETNKEELKKRAERELALQKNSKSFVETSCSNLQSIPLKGPWAAYGFTKTYHGLSRSIEAHWALWGGGKAWGCVFSGTQNQYDAFKRILETAIWKVDATGQAPVALSDIPLPPQESRTWTNAAGKTFEGMLTAIGDGDLLTIERADGQTFHGIPMSFLSAKDRQHINALMDEMEKNARKPAALEAQVQ